MYGNPVMSLLFSVALLTPVQAQHAYYDVSDYAETVDFLQPGEFEWTDSTPGQGQVLVVIDLQAQRAYVYRNQQRIAVSTISSGRTGMETPTGVYDILEKKKIHHSNLYDDAPMPFMQRLTWHGVALHAGRIPGHPASHGCVRLPAQFARQLFAITTRGDSLVIVSEQATDEALRQAGAPEYLVRMLPTPSDNSDVAAMNPVPPFNERGASTSWR
jgi:hypothetical protein